jgi:fluoroacetyl-CoA thioesterase
MRLEPGRRATFRYTVTDADTAAAVGSGEVPVLATPRVLALAVASSSRCASVTATGRWPAA